METKEKKVKKKTDEKVNYVIIDGKKVSRTWAAVLANKGSIEVLDMRAVLK